MKRLTNFTNWENRNIGYKLHELYQMKDGKLDIIKRKKLTSLPEIPENIKHINCYENGLTSLPELPDELERLYCYSNQLTSLPKLPDKLQYLNCSYNKLSLLPKLPEGLIGLYCYNNNLTSLPELPEGLERLQCYNNPLECIIPAKFLTLQTSEWLNDYYRPFIKSYEGQKKILTRQPEMVKELELQTVILAEIKKEFSHLFTGVDLNLI